MQSRSVRGISESPVVQAKHQIEFDGRTYCRRDIEVEGLLNFVTVTHK